MQLAELHTRIDDHEERLLKLEARKEIDFYKFEGQEKKLEHVLARLDAAVKKFEETTEKMYLGIEEKFASKNDLAALKSEINTKILIQAAEGPWRTRFMNLVSGVVGAILITAISLFFSQAS